MGVIIPAILVSSRLEIEAQLALVKGLVDTVQIDLVDKTHTKTPTWPFLEGGFETLPESFDVHDLGDFRFEMDLMVHDVGGAVRACLKTGAGKLIVHAEAVDDMGALLDELENEYGRDKELSPDLLSIAIAIHADTDPARYEPFLPRVDYVQFMGIAREGVQGEPFDERVLEKIREVRKKYPELLMQVDGGVSPLTAPQLLSAGVNRLVVGSALWKSKDIAGTLHTFESLIEEYGRYH